jgi:hypothetical protein
LADEYAFELIELTAMTCAAIRSRLKRELGFLTGRRSRRDHGNSHRAAARPIKHFRHAAVTCRTIQQWRCNMKKLVTGMLVTSVALAMLVGTEGAYARENRKAPDATYDQQDRGTAIDTESTGEEGISGPRVRVQPGDVLTGGRVIGADPDPFIRNQLLRDYDSGTPD